MLKAEIVDIIENLDKPVIAAVHGFAITGGFLLAYACDMIVASEDAIFQDTHGRWGLVPGWGEAQLLPRLVGMTKAKQLMFTSDRLTGKEAERIGLVYRAVPADKLDEDFLSQTIMWK